MREFPGGGGCVLNEQGGGLAQRAGLVSAALAGIEVGAATAAMGVQRKSALSVALERVGSADSCPALAVYEDAP